MDKNVQMVRVTICLTPSEANFIAAEAESSNRTPRNHLHELIREAIREREVEVSPIKAEKSEE